MTERELGESNRQLREVAGELKVSDRRLRRWRDEGLLPKPIARRGKGRAVGSETFYPVGTSAQLRAVARWFKRYPRKLERVRWALWCDGFDVQIDWETLLLSQLSEARAVASDHLSAFEEDKPGNLIEMLEEGHVPSGLRRLVRQGGQSDFVALVATTMMVVATGELDLLPKDEEEMGSPMLHAVPKELRDLLAPYGALAGMKVGRGLGTSLGALNYAALEEYLREDLTRLESARDEALHVFRRVWPERAGTDALPETLFLFALMSQSGSTQASKGAAIGQPRGVEKRPRNVFAAVVDWLCEQPQGVRIAKKWLEPYMKLLTRGKGL